MKRHEVATRKLICELPDGGVTVRHDVPCRGSSGHELAFDIYRPAGSERAHLPVVLFVTGFPDAGLRRMIGCHAKDMASCVGWARLVAASGLVAVTYTNDEPVEDARSIVRHLRENAHELGIDAERIGVWACSGNVPNALSLLIEASPRLACAALCYGYMLDLDGSTIVADAARAWRFANPCAGRAVEDLPADLPILIVRAGRDETPGVNESIDLFVSRALALNRPVTVVNHHTAPHAFDTADASETSRAAIQQILRFLIDYTEKEEPQISPITQTSPPDATCAASPRFRSSRS